MPLHDLTDFLKLSSALNYNLSAASLNRFNVLMFILDNKKLQTDEKRDREQKGIMMEALSYLFSAYRQKRRRLGPMAVLHPLRTTALLARTLDTLNLIDLLTTLFHDLLEDITSSDFDATQWREMEWQLYTLLDRLDSDSESQLVHRLVCLTRLKTESYYQYIGRLLDCSYSTVEVVKAKLADRLDNTLDMRMVLQDPLEGVDFFQNIFQLLFVNTYKGYEPEVIHPPSVPLNGARRLYQLFKNAVLLSLVRQKKTVSESQPFRSLFDAICEASLNEAQRTLIHVTGYHHKGVARQRELLLEAMAYCHSGGTDQATKPVQENVLDGLFATYFGSSSSKTRNHQLDALYQNKSLMIQASVAFIVIFLNFLNDPNYYIRGISERGLDPK